MCMPWRVYIFVCVVLFVHVSMPTYLVCDSKRSVKPVVLDDGAAPLRRADGADIRHAQRVAGVVATKILNKRNSVSLNKATKNVLNCTVKVKLFQKTD